MLKSTKRIKKIYMDYTSSALSMSSNPGAIHELGVKEKNKLEDARVKVARILEAKNDEIIFTSGATESNNLAIQGLIYAVKEKGFSLKKLSSSKGAQLLNKPHIITTNIEHASVLETCKHLETTKQVKGTYVPVESNGIIDPKKIRKALRLDTSLVSVMYANNEIGTIQPIREIAKEIRHYNKKNSKKIYFHTDATQAINYLPINVSKLGVDLMSFNGAKIYGPKGIGILYVKKGTPIRKIMFGGNQERGLRPGTENVAGALGLAKALEVAEKIKNKEVKRLTKLRDYFITSLHSIFSSEEFGLAVRSEKKKKIVKFTVNGDLKNRLPNNINITIPGIPSDLLVIELSARGVMASAKSACKSGDGKASHVIEAINKPARNASHSDAGGNIRDTDGSLRFSLGRETTKSDINYTVKALSQILTKLKKWYN